MDLVLRKRLAINIYKRQSFTDKLKKIGRLGRADSLAQTGVTYEVVSNIPKASEELEDRESLAQMAASGDDSGDGEETYIGKIFFIRNSFSIKFYYFYFKFILIKLEKN